MAAEWTVAELAAGVVRGPAAAAQDSDWPLLGWLRELLFEMGASARADFLQFVTVRRTSDCDEGVVFVREALLYKSFQERIPMKQSGRPEIGSPIQGRPAAAAWPRLT